MSVNDSQRDFWTDEAGHIWVDQRAGMDAILAAVLDQTLAGAELEQGHSVLDIGCGAGTSTLAISEQVGDTGHVTGVDISQTLLTAAQERSIGRSNIGFLDSDVQSHSFVAQSADAIVSRFGVMFFEDSIAAFKNMATALRTNGILSFSAWGAISENPFFTLPAQISRQILGPVPRSDPDCPGPFAFRDPVRIDAILRAADLLPQIDVRSETLHTPQGAQAVAETMCLIGPAHMAITHYEADTAQRQTLLDALTDALSTYEEVDGIRIPAQINYVTARIST